MGVLGTPANPDDGLAGEAGNAPPCVAGFAGGCPNAAKAPLGALAGRENPSKGNGNGAEARW